MYGDVHMNCLVINHIPGREMLVIGGTIMMGMKEAVFLVWEQSCAGGHQVTMHMDM